MAFELELTSPIEVAKDFALAVQEYTLLSAQSLANFFRRPLYMGDMLYQADLIGVGSLPIVILTGLSVGALLALNAASTLQRFGSVTLIGQLVSIGMVTELGPLITGLMVAGRNSSGMASELGSMIVTEQIDAMRALGTDPTKKLITPRVGATVFMLFFLTIIADLLGLIGGYAVAHLLFGVDTNSIGPRCGRRWFFATAYPPISPSKSAMMVRKNSMKTVAPTRGVISFLVGCAQGTHGVNLFGHDHRAQFAGHA